jgi:hypothetical protein
LGRVRAFRTNLGGQGPVTGFPCASSGIQPRVGVRQASTGARLTVSGAPPNALTVLCVAPASQTSYAGTPLPIALDSYGLHGCNLYVGALAMVTTVTGTASIDRGYSFVDVPRNLASAGLGTAYNAQWVVFDPSNLGYAATAKHQFRVQ